MLALLLATLLALQTLPLSLPPKDAAIVSLQRCWRAACEVGAQNGRRSGWETETHFSAVGLVWTMAGCGKGFESKLCGI